MKVKPINLFSSLLLIFIWVLLINTQTVTAKASAKKIIFLHHSTGRNVYNTGEVRGRLTGYNYSHKTTHQIFERWYPDAPNYPYDYWNLWINGACNSNKPGRECMNTLAKKYDVIIFKHCYPGSDLLPDNQRPSISSNQKTLGNYKLQYRTLRKMMDKYPDTIFIIWTLAPRHRLATNAGNASRARIFADWVRTDFLTEDGKPHPNIFIFDFWKIVAENNLNPARGKVNCLKYKYEKNHSNSDSHPNEAANKVAGPLFVKCIVESINSFHP